MAVLRKSPLHVQSAGGVGIPSAEVTFSSPSCHLLQQDFDQLWAPHTCRYVSTDSLFSYILVFHISSLYFGW